MKNNEQKLTNPQQLNCNTKPLFEPLNLAQQDSAVGGLFSLSILDAFPADLLIPGREEAEAAAAAAEAAGTVAVLQAQALGFSIQFPLSLLLN
ncbi:MULTISPECIES: hypothetical protein [unclassified Nodularia (in: cyanobacteria)]|uniref:hypothetical protein n=1 Tax=unclassified Nodularia (in: cyanobacteria) TaxID=2656917 RepID=UPI001D11A21C|nr:MULTISPECIES: hypothetical protein [unclassified Nodularia (in: cyanobacteria)]